MMKFIDYLRGMVSRGAVHLIASFRYSLDGFGACFRDETAFRQEVAVGAVHFVLSFALQLSLTVFVYLTVLYVLLLAVELINTAVEAAVDCAVNDRHPLAKKAKDCASAAVFCVIAIFVVSWIVVLAKMFGESLMKFQLKCRDWMAGLVPLALCCVLVAFDILSQQTLSRLSLGGWAYQMQQSLCWGLMLSSLAFFLGNWARWFYLPLFLLLLVTDVAETYVRWQFGVNFKGDWMLVLQASSPSELYNFWIDNVWSLIGSGLMLLGAGVVISWLTWCARYPRRSARNFIVGLAFLLPMLMINCRGNPLHRAFGAAIFHQVVSDTFANVRMFKDLGVVHGNPEGLSDVKLSVSLDKAPTCVIVIGESATRNNFGIYGYERDTTPFLSSIRDELCVFQDLVGVWNNTPPAIRFLFTGATADDKNHARMMITQAAKKAGYPQAFVSNQGRWGHMNNTITYIFDTADSCVFLEDLKLPKPYYDDALLPHLDKALASSSGGQVVYLHQSGSHYPFRGLYPTNQAPFGVTRTIDHYDNTVHFTDGVIREVVTRLKALHRPAMMFYVSDHGDTPRAKSWRSFDDKDLWELPMVVWFSEEYKSSFPDTVAAVEKATALPLQSDQVLPGLLKMMQIDGWADSASEKCFLNPVFKPRKVRMIKNWSEPYKKLNR